VFSISSLVLSPPPTLVNFLSTICPVGRTQWVESHEAFEPKVSCSVICWPGIFHKSGINEWESFYIMAVLAQWEMYWEEKTLNYYHCLTYSFICMCVGITGDHIKMQILLLSTFSPPNPQFLHLWIRPSSDQKYAGKNDMQTEHVQTLFFLSLSPNKMVLFT
jgi:hypothetical protein